MSNKIIDISKHIYNHAAVIIKTNGNTAMSIKSEKELLEHSKSIKEDIVNYKFSYDYSNFENEEEAVKKLTYVMNDLHGISADSTYKKTRTQRFIANSENEERFEKRDDIRIISKEYASETYYNKTREIVKYNYEKTYERVGNLKNCFIAVHVKSYEEVNGKKIHDVLPHIHIVFQKSRSNFGNGYSALKEEVMKINDKYNLTCSIQKLDKRDKLENISKNMGNEFRILKDRLSSFSWAISKNAEFYKENDWKYRNKYCVNLSNIEEKVNRYLQLGGSKSFAEKIQSKVKAYYNIDIILDKTNDEINAERNIKERRYIDIIEDISFCCINNYKVPEAYRNLLNYSKEKVIDISEIRITKMIKDILTESRYKFDNSGNKYIDVESINNLKSKYLYELKYLEKRIEIETILTEPDMRKYLFENNIKLEDIKSGTTMLKQLYENNVNYVKDKCKGNSDTDVKTFVNNMEHLSDKWKENIFKEITSNVDIKDYSTLKYNDRDNGSDERNINIIRNNISFNEQEIINMFVKREFKINVHERIKELNLGVSDKKINYYTNIFTGELLGKIDEFKDKYSNLRKHIFGFERIEILKEEREKLVALLNIKSHKSDKNIIKNEYETILNQDELRKYIKDNNLDLEKTSGKTIFEILFENNLSVARNLVKDFDISEYRNVINRMDSLSDSWKEKITNLLITDSLNSEESKITNRINEIDKQILYSEKYDVSNYMRYLNARYEYNELANKYLEKGVVLPKMKDREERTFDVNENRNTISYEDIIKQSIISQKIEVYNRKEDRTVYIEQKLNERGDSEVRASKYKDPFSLPTDGNVKEYREYGSIADAQRTFSKENGYKAVSQEIKRTVPEEMPIQNINFNNMQILFDEQLKETTEFRKEDSIDWKVIDNQNKRGEDSKSTDICISKKVTLYNEKEKKTIYAEERISESGKTEVRVSKNNKPFEAQSDSKLKEYKEYPSLDLALQLFTKEKGYKPTYEESQMRASNGELYVKNRPLLGEYRINKQELDKNNDLKKDDFER